MTDIELFRDNPELFDIHPNGKIVITGHRVPVFSVMEELAGTWNLPNQLEYLCLRFPSINPDLMNDVVAFIAEHWDELRPFFDKEKELAEKAFQDYLEDKTR